MECNNVKLSKKLIRSKSGLRIVVTDVDYRSPFVMGEPDWTPDKEVSNCTKCSAKFGFTTRKHHCRRCGHIYCSACCDVKLDLLRMGFIDPVRVCDDCAPTTLQENKFFEYHLKVLTGGAPFSIKNRPRHDDDDDNYKFKLLHCDDGNKEEGDDKCDKEKEEDNDIVICKLSMDHRYLVFDGVKSGNSSVQFSPNPLQLDRIKTFRIYNDLPDTGDNIRITSMELVYDVISDGDNIYRGEEEEEVVSSCILTLSTPPSFMVDNDKSGGIYKQSSNWILAMQQAFKLIYKKSEIATKEPQYDEKR